METTPKTLARSAVVIGLVLVGLAAVGGQPELARGIALSAVVMLGNLGLWVLAVRRLFDAVASGASPHGASFFFTLKLVSIGGIVWGLLQLASPMAVLLGGSVVVLSILAHAAVLAARTLWASAEA